MATIPRNNTQQQQTLDQIRNLVTRIHRFGILHFEYLALGPGQAAVLREIIFHPGLTQSSLSRRLGLHKSRISRIVAHLESIHYVERKLDQFDRRTRLVYPAPMARALKPGILASNAEMPKLLCGNAESDDLAALDNYLQFFRQNIALARQLHLHPEKFGMSFLFPPIDVPPPALRVVGHPAKEEKDQPEEPTTRP
ncbi:MAG: MarR family transcriptional regulator [bacterium]